MPHAGSAIGCEYKNGLLNSNQYGFRKGHSTSHLLIEAVNDWAETLDCRGSCDTVYC